MFKVGEFVVYNRDVCKVIDIKNNHFNENDYYFLTPISDESLKIEIPTTTELDKLRPLISKNEIKKIISAIPSVEVVEVENRLMDKEYKVLINSGNHLDLIKIIKTTYMRNKERLENKKKIADKENNYFLMAEKHFYLEIATVLKISYDEAKEYVANELEKIYAEEKNR